MNTPTSQRGFALLIGVVIATILISLAYIMFSITLKSLSLTTSARNSETAIFAADTGVECALFADYKTPKAFTRFSVALVGNNSTITLKWDKVPAATSTVCAGSVVNYTPTTGNTIVVNGTTYTNAVVSELTVTPVGYPSAEYCAKVTVSKYVQSTNVGGNNLDLLKTKIESRGYNICPDAPFSASNPLRVERGLEVYY